MYNQKQAVEYLWHLGEDAVKAGATGALLAVNGMAQNILAWDWLTVAGYAGSAAAISVLISLGAKNAGVKNTTSFLPAKGKHLP